MKKKKAVVLSMGEATTKICCDQLIRYGFDVVLIEGKETMLEKYKLFIETAIKLGEEIIVKVDADVIVNESIKDVKTEGVTAYQTYNFYTNKLGYNGVMVYSKKVLEIIAGKLDYLEVLRPECSANRLKEVNCHLNHLQVVVGLHGFFQTSEDMKRVRHHTLERGHIYDDEFINKIQAI